jgi:hypothetical protein
MSFIKTVKNWVNPNGNASSRKQVLRLVLVGSLALHALGAIIFGGIRLVTAMMQEETVFVAQPPVRTYEPRQVELKVKVQNKQRSSSRPQVVPRLVAARPANISLPDIKVDPKLVTTTFQPKFKAVSGTGLGVGFGTGYGTSGFGQGVAQVNFFGIQAAGERIAVCVDVSVSMVEEERGGPAGFLRVKQRVGEVIDAIKDGTQFNLIVFADGCSILEPAKMLFSTPETRTKAKQFLAPFNTEGQWGHDGGNFSGYNKGLQAGGGTTRLDLAIAAAMSQGADTLLIISDGLPAVRKVLTEQQREAYNRTLADWQTQNAGAMQAFERAQAAAPPPQVRTRRVWVPPQAAQPARPPSKAAPREGQAIDRGSPGSPARDGYWTEVTETIGGGGGPPRPTPPAPPPLGNWTLADFVQHISLIYKDVYVAKSLKLPRIHCIGYQIDKDGGDFLKRLSEQYKGQFRMVRKLR